MKKMSGAMVVAAILVSGWLGYRVVDHLKESGGFEQRSIKVGILHSLSGTMAISEKSVVDATLLAIDEINQAGGLCGQRIEPVVVDGRSDWPIFATEAERLITQEGVSVVFGCWTSASRRTVKPIFEHHDHLLFYPVQYEGLEVSSNIVYTGAAPNQQIIPAVKWCADNIGRKFFLVGSDYVFPRTANAMIRDQLTALRCEVLGEEYILLGSTKVDRSVRLIVETQPDVILNTINGDSNLAFFKALRAAGITPEKIPTMSFSVAEDELRTLGSEDMVGDYACWNYFQSIESQENRRFVEAFREKYGADRVTDDPMEAAYSGVHFWAQAVREAGSSEPRAVRQHLANQTFQAPGGIRHIDAENQHTWKIVRIGRVQADGQFEIKWSSEKPVRPVPYPIYRSPSEWHDFLDSLYQDWNGNWSNPGP